MFGRVAVAMGDGGPAQEDAPVLDADLRAGDRPAIVDAAARSFRGSVRRHHRNAQILGRCAQARVDGRAADQDGIESAQRVDPLDRIHGLGQLQRGQRGIGAVPGAVELCGRAGKGRDIEALAEIHA